MSGQGGAGRGFASAASDGMGLAEWGGSRGETCGREEVNVGAEVKTRIW